MPVPGHELEVLTGRLTCLACPEEGALLGYVRDEDLEGVLVAHAASAHPEAESQPQQSAEEAPPWWMSD